MNSDVISVIKDAEAKCEDLYSSKVEESQVQIRDAKTTAKADADAKVKAYNEQCQKRLEEATSKAKQDAAGLLDQNQLQCKALRDVADQNMQKCVDYILGRIVG